MHSVAKELADGTWRWYARAWRGRGAPTIATGDGKTKEAAYRALQDALSDPHVLAKLSNAREAQEKSPKSTVAYAGGLVTAYLKSAEYSALAPRTRSDYRRHLTKYRDEFGDWRTSLFEDPRTVQDLAEWRDEFSSPRQGHMQIQVISILFSWARSRGITKANPTEAIRKVYNADRSDQIWLPDQLDAVLDKSPAPLQWAIRLAAETGLRQGDLLRLPWSAVSDVSIQSKTSKRGKRVIIPITADIRAVLDEIPRRSPVVLTSSTGHPWTQDGLRASFHRAKTRAKKARAQIDGLTWHDLRGTAVTRLYGTQLKKRELAQIFGWSEDRVEAILARYVSADAIALDMLKRISTEQDV